MKEKRLLSVMDVWSLCRRKNWYTCGCNAEYDAMLEKIQAWNTNDEDITADMLYEIARDIKLHSDTQLNTIEIVYILDKVSITIFYEV